MEQYFPSFCRSQGIEVKVNTGLHSGREIPRSRAGAGVRILVVDDEAGIAESLRQILVASGYDALAVHSAAQALEVLPAFNPQLVISDVVMPTMSGIELVAELRSLYPGTLIILLSGNAATEELITLAGEKLKPLVVLAKPIPPRQLLGIIAEIIAGENDHNAND